jgi:hypothetical protein
MNIANYMGKRLRENEIGKAYGLSSGKLNTWDLPEFASQTLYWSTETSNDIYALGISGFTDNL